MNDKINHIDLGGVSYPICFNLNVMEEIQEEYGSIENWGNLVEGDGEPKIKDIKKGLLAMINEAIDIENEEAEFKIQPLTSKKLGRLIGENLIEVLQNIKKTTIESVDTGEQLKNE